MESEGFLETPLQQLKVRIENLTSSLLNNGVHVVIDVLVIHENEVLVFNYFSKLKLGLLVIDVRDWELALVSDRKELGACFIYQHLHNVVSDIGPLMVIYRLGALQNDLGYRDVDSAPIFPLVRPVDVREHYFVFCLVLLYVEWRAALLHRLLWRDDLRARCEYVIWAWFPERDEDAASLAWFLIMIQIVAYQLRFVRVGTHWLRVTDFG